MDVPLLYDAAGHVGYAFLAFGMYLLAQKSQWGWVCRFIGEAIWLILGFLIGMTAIWFWGFLFLAMELYGFWRWKHE